MNNHSATFTLEHIDPQNSALVSGLRVDLNEILAEPSYNYSKGSLFVPYRVCDYPAPVHPGDTAEFLIKGEWVITEFYGEWWRLEAIDAQLTHSSRGGVHRANWEQRIKDVEEKWQCHIIVCSPDGRLRKDSLAMRHCDHTSSEPSPLWFYTKPRNYCCLTHMNRSFNDRRKN